MILCQWLEYSCHGYRLQCGGEMGLFLVVIRGIAATERILRYKVSMGSISIAVSTI